MEMSSPPAKQNLQSGEGACCSWCGHGGIEQGAIHGQASPSTGQVFCSEFCFSQCRRAAFKRAKVCDWCKHVRHTVSYVDFHDGDRQLQFCGDKCLNQYKMQLFCKEATSLGMAPKPGSQSTSEASTSPLITPDLWMRNCQSPENLSDSTDSDTESNAGPLNYSMRNVPVKRPSDAQIAESSVSKKGKSHRKVSPVSSPRRSNLPVQQWPVLPHPAFLPPSLLGFQNQLIRFNMAEKSPRRAALLPVPSTSKVRKLNADESSSKTPSLVDLTVKADAKVEPKRPEVPKSSNTAPHIVLSPYPLLVPLPIPVPIPIPINIHEKYLKRLTS